MLKRTISLVLALMLAVSVLALPSSATTYGETSTQLANLSPQKVNRLTKLLNMKAAEMSSSTFEKSTPRTVDTIKYATDFNGAIYTIAELSPTGYIIYHNESGLYAEYSATAISPYQGFSDGLFYCGPTQYYTLQKDSYVHTKTGETLDVEEDGDALKSNSLQLEKHYKEQIDVNNLKFVNYGIVPAYSKAAEAPKYIPGAEQIRNMKSEKEMSYCSPSGTNGICGYIAAAITLAFFDKYWNEAVIDNNTYLSQARGYKVFDGNPKDYQHSGSGYKRTLSYNLWHYCSPNPNDNGSSVSWTIRDTLNTYLKENRGITALSVTDNLLPSSWGIANYLDETKRPVILFGSIGKPGTSKGNHAVVVYGHKQDELIAHYGWDQCSEVNINGIWGSLVKIDY